MTIDITAPASVAVPNMKGATADYVLMKQQPRVPSSDDIVIDENERYSLRVTIIDDYNGSKRRHFCYYQGGDDLFTCLAARSLRMLGKSALKLSGAIQQDPNIFFKSGEIEAIDLIDHKFADRLQEREVAA
jgi:hypothetical protein